MLLSVLTTKTEVQIFWCDFWKIFVIDDWKYKLWFIVAYLYLVTTQCNCAFNYYHFLKGKHSQVTKKSDWWSVNSLAQLYSQRTTLALDSRILFVIIMITRQERDIGSAEVTWKDSVLNECVINCITNIILLSWCDKNDETNMGKKAFNSSYSSSLRKDLTRSIEGKEAETIRKYCLLVYFHRSY